jgi:hypothetical protein
VRLTYRKLKRKKKLCIRLTTHLLHVTFPNMALTVESQSVWLKADPSATELTGYVDCMYWCGKYPPPFSVEDTRLDPLQKLKD